MEPGLLSSLPDKNTKILSAMPETHFSVPLGAENRVLQRTPGPGNNQSLCMLRRDSPAWAFCALELPENQSVQTGHILVNCFETSKKGLVYLLFNNKDNKGFFVVYFPAVLEVSKKLILFFIFVALFSFNNDINLPNNLLPVAITFKKFSCSLTSNIILRALKFASKDCRHIRLAAAALWSVKSEFGSGYCWVHRLVLALALAVKLWDCKIPCCMQWAENGLSIGKELGR